MLLCIMHVYVSIQLFKETTTVTTGHRTWDLVITRPMLQPLDCCCLTHARTHARTHTHTHTQSYIDFNTYTQHSICHLQDLIHLINKVIEELQGIPLFSYINWLSIKFKVFPKSIWCVILQVALLKMTKYSLQIW